LLVIGILDKSGIEFDMPQSYTHNIGSYQNMLLLLDAIADKIDNIPEQCLCLE
jgi:hypothetical protein